MKNLKEKCILCNKELDIRKDTHIHLRSYYVEGVGQLCLQCFLKIKQ